MKMALRLCTYRKCYAVNSIPGDLCRDILSNSNTVFSATKAQTMSTRHKEKEQ